MDAIVLFDPADSGEKLKEAAHHLGFKVIGVFDLPENTFQDLFHVAESALFPGCDEVIVSEDLDEILRKLKSSKFSIRAVIAATEGGVELADQIAHALDLWRNPVQLSSARRDKGEMRQVLKKSGLSCPAFCRCSKEAEIVRFAKEHPFPLVVKTPKGFATGQVFVCQDLKSLKLAFHEIYGKADVFGHAAESVIVEEFISGREYIVDTFSDGKDVHVTDVWYYDKVESKHFQNLYYNVVSLPISAPTLQGIRDYAIQVTKAFQIERGPAHLEIKDDPVKGPTLIEIGARLAGSHLPEWVQRYSNFDPYLATVEVFANGKTHVPNPIELNNHLAIVYCPVMKGGKLKQVSGIEDIQKLPSYHVHHLNVETGKRLSESSHSSSIPLVVYLAHSDRERCLNDMKAVHELFSVEFED